MSNSLSIECLIRSIGMVAQGVQELGLATHDLRQMEDCQGKQVHVDFVIENEWGEKIGVRSNGQGQVDFIAQDTKSVTVKKTLDKVKQAYARIKVIDEVKRKGYQQVKEEKLADGSIRLVVQRWR